MPYKGGMTKLETCVHIYRVFRIDVKANAADPFIRSDAGSSSASIHTELGYLCSSMPLQVECPAFTIFYKDIARRIKGLKV